MSTIYQLQINTVSTQTCDASNSSSKASVSSDERCWCCSSKSCFLLDVGVNNANAPGDAANELTSDELK